MKRDFTGRVSASPTVLRFSDGKDYFFHPLTDKEFDMLDEWLQTRYVENAIKALPDKMPEVRQNSLINSVVKESLKITFLSMEGIQLLATLQGMVFTCWLSMRKSHPELTQDQVRELLMSEGNLKLVNQAFKKVNSVPAADHPTRANKPAKLIKQRRNKIH